MRPLSHLMVRKKQMQTKAHKPRDPWRFAGAVAFSALLLSLGGAAIGFSHLGSLLPVLISALLVGVTLEFASGQLSASGYFSLASPVVLSLSLLGGTEHLALAVALSGVVSVGRLANKVDPLETRLIGAGINVLRTLLVGGAMLAASPLTLPVQAAVGFTIWLALDSSLINLVIQKTAGEASRHTWEGILVTSRALLALPPVAAALAAPLLPTAPSEAVLGILGLGLASFPFGGALVRIIHGLEMEGIERELLSTQHQCDKMKSRFNNQAEELKRLNSQLASVHDLARNLGASSKLEETLKVVMASVSLRIPFHSCVIFLARNGNLTPVLTQTSSERERNLKIFNLVQPEEIIIDEVLASLKPRLNGNLPSGPEGRVFVGERSAMCVPLMVGKELVGIIYVGSRKKGTHTVEHFDHLKMLAAFAAPSMKAAKLLEDKEKDLAVERQGRAAVEAKNAQLAGLQQMGQRMGHSLKSQDTLRAVAESLKQMIGAAQSVILFSKDATDDTLQAEFADTPYSAYVKNIALRDDEGLLGKALRLGQTLLIPNTALYGVQNLLGSESSVVVAPLQSGEGEPLGILYVGSDKENALTEEHRNIIETVSYQAAMALKNARLYEQTQQLALTDGLTGLYTHRLFQEKLSDELESARRGDEPLVLVMVDADNFKTYNDTLGHQAGDSLLIEIANLLRDKVRSTDIVCRYGGDEFALLLKNTSKTDAQRLCERIREAFQLRFGGNEVQVTSSIGLACFPVDAESKKDLARAADDALYVSKRGGRNRVSVSPTLEERQAPPIVVEVLPR